MLFKVECKHDCCWVEVNLATLTYLGYYQILDIGVSLSVYSRNICIFIYVNRNKMHTSKIVYKAKKCK